jgi:hypothetical protein
MAQTAGPVPPHDAVLVVMGRIRAVKDCMNFGLCGHWGLSFEDGKRAWQGQEKCERK